MGFEATEVALHENDTLKLGIGVLAGAGTEIPFSISYFTASGTAQGTIDLQPNLLHDTSAIIWWILSWVHNIMYHVLIIFFTVY